MHRNLITVLLLILLALPAWAKRDIRLDPDYDPRIELRVVVLPATKVRSLNRVSERTISALFSTEMLREYEVVDLERFEQYLSDRRFSLDNAFTVRAESVVRDSARIDAIANIEIYLWDPGTGGIPLLGRQSGQIGARIRVMDPFTGRLYWSVNRVEGVSPGDEFLDRATVFFKDLVDDLDRELSEERRERNELDAQAGMIAQGAVAMLPGHGKRKFTGMQGKERGFVPRLTPQELDRVLRTHTAAPEVTQPKPDQPDQAQGILPPLFEGKYEDIEAQGDTQSSSQAPRQGGPGAIQGPKGTMPGETPNAGPPPLPARFRLDNQPQVGTEQPKGTRKNGGG